MPGFDYKFLEKPKRRFQCPLCSKAMREPVQVSTCGHRFCDTCLQEFLSSPHTCQASWLIGARSHGNAVQWDGGAAVGTVPRPRQRWVSVSEWEQRHGWLMNDCVFISVPVPPSHHRDAHSPLQVDGHPGSGSGEV
ncbi:TNF receptor-associated factor 4 [Liparis tanakae]|uniref:TNF receptor-associated factor 4 n=1 Tax=Liparis tanakae TaxID=230148 RepID=A0A4Z2HBD8_9TELE|nr:TNF receptor-associated factor 4 [Liparis tanakae]